MPPAAMIGIAAGAALVGAYGQYKAGQDQKAAMKAGANMMSPWAIRQRIQALNPMLYNAAYGPNIFQQDLQGLNTQKTFGGYLDRLAMMGEKVKGNRMAAMFQLPGYQDPRMMNYGLQMGDVGVNNAAQAAGGMIGRMSAEGGMADAYAFANQALKTRLRAEAWNQFRAQGEMLARQDVTESQGLLNQAQSQATGQAAQAAQFRSQAYNPFNWATGVSQAVSTGIGTYGALQGIAGQQKQQQPVQSAQTPWQTGFNVMSPQMQGRSLWAQPAWQGDPGGFNPSFGNSYNPYGFGG